MGYDSVSDQDEQNMEITRTKRADTCASGIVPSACSKSANGDFLRSVERRRRGILGGSARMWSRRTESSIKTEVCGMSAAILARYPVLLLLALGK